MTTDETFSTAQVEWENSTSFDLPTDFAATARWRLTDVPLDRIAGRFGSWESYVSEEPDRMSDLVEALDELPAAAFLMTDDGHYLHVDGAHRVIIRRHLGLTSIPAYVTEETLDAASQSGVG